MTGTDETTRFAEIHATYGDLVRASVVDGVRVVHAAAPGPLSAALLFRVGVNDEPLPVRGITHLIEHLALHQSDGAAQHTNGQVQGSFTQFMASGSEKHVVTLLNAVCAALREPPVERLEVEKTILTTETQSRPPTADDALWQARFGAVSAGRVSFDEYGLEAIDAETVDNWVRQWFVAENAVLWLSSDTIPDGLDLRLPSGSASPRPLVQQIDRPRPLSIVGPPRIAMVDAIVPRSSAASVSIEVMRSALFRELRREGGLSYTVHATYDPIDAEHARLLVFADATEENQAAVVGAMVDALAALKAGRVDERDLETAMSTVTQGIAAWRETGAVGVMAAQHLLFGEEMRSLESIEAEVASLTPADLVGVVRAFWDDAIWMTPDAPVDWIGAHPVDYSTGIVDGRWFDYVASREKLVVGEEGVSWVFADRVLTVRYADCELLGIAADGARMLVGRDSVTVTIEPTLAQGLEPSVLEEIDNRVPLPKQVRYPARAAEGIPIPPPVPSPPPARLGWLIAGIVAIAAAVPLAIAVAVAMPAGALFIGVALAGIFLLARRLDARRLQHRVDLGLARRGVLPDETLELMAFALSPTRTVRETAAALRTALGQPEPASDRPRRAPLFIYFDRSVICIEDRLGDRLVTLPAALVTDVSTGEMPVITSGGHPTSVASVRLRVSLQGRDHELVVSPIGDFTHNVSPTEVDQFGVVLRSYLGLS